MATDMSDGRIVRQNCSGDEFFRAKMRFFAIFSLLCAFASAKTSFAEANPTQMEPWKKQVEDVLRNIPLYDPWAQAEEIGAWLDHGAAIKAINWFADHVKHVDGKVAGRPFELRPWQAAIVGNLFGWKRKDEDGAECRRYRRCFLYVPRGNGKTPLVSGIMLYVLFNDGEPAGQNYLAACKREQAGILFRNIRGMVEQDAELIAEVKIYGGDQQRSLILNADKFTFCKVIPGDGKGQHGGIPHAIAFDELHEQEDRQLYEVFETSMAKKTRRQPLLLMLTTADYDRPSLCNEVYKNACEVRDNGGRADRPGLEPSFLPVIYEAAPEDDWTSEEIWRKANPNLDVSVSLRELREACRKAQENPIKENGFRRLHLNQRTAQDVRLIPLKQWDACLDTTLKLEDFVGKACYGGLDLSSCEDLTSFYLVFPCGERFGGFDDDSVAIFGWSWCPSMRVAERARKKAVPYDVWVKAGHIFETPGGSVDYGMVREKIVECDQRFQILKIFADPSMARETVTNLNEQQGFVDRVVEFAQTINNLSSPTKQLISKVKHKKLRHDGNPVTRWAAGNLAGYYKGTIPPGETLDSYLDKVPVMPSKQSSADKIDPIAAIIFGLAAKEANPEQGGSVYESRGVLAF
jgi:phage terminase large subunit-like protein